MSVLYKALQKAAKENERHAAEAAGSGFDPDRLAGSGAIRLAGGGRGLNWRIAGLSASLILAVAIVAAFFLVDPSSSPQVAPARPGAVEAIAVMQPPAQPSVPAVNPMPAPVQPEVAVQTSPELQPPATAAVESAPVAAAADTVSETAAPAVEPVVAEVAPVAPAADAPIPLTPQSSPRAAAPAVASAPAAVKAPAREPAPAIAADSPARMLNPPISIRREQFALSGIGDSVQVREVSQEAQDNVGAGYNALISGSYDTALGFYDRALKEEPTSILALLGRGAALHKLRRFDEARLSYERVLQIDPQNREALANVTAIASERAPGEALAKLLDMEREYPGFSPIKAQIGLTYAKMGTLQEAANYLQRAISLTPDASSYSYNLALVLDRMGRREQAVAAYERVLNVASMGRASPDLPVSDIERRVRFLRAQ